MGRQTKPEAGFHYALKGVARSELSALSCAAFSLGAAKIK
jgi:hypothetical protein